MAAKRKTSSRNAAGEERVRPDIQHGTTHNLTTNELRQLLSINSVLSSRALAASKLGMSFGDNRDLYLSVGYPQTTSYNDYRKMFDRQDIAGRLCTAYPDATWKGVPEVVDDEDQEITTPFEKEWYELARRLNIYHYFSRVDTLGQIGRYAVLLLGFDDANPLDVEVSGAKELLYVQPYSERNATIESYDQDPKSARFGLPAFYQISTNAPLSEDGTTPTGTAMTKSDGTETGKGTKVHWSRVLHVAEGLLENEVYGTPILKRVYNRMMDLGKVCAGVGEGFWQAVFGGISFEADKDVDLSQSVDDLDDEIQNYVHNFQRYLRLQGVSAKPLSPRIADCENPSELFLKLISGATGIPIRILTGSERGELASSQDESNWNSRVAERRTDFAEPLIVKAFVERLVMVGVLTAPTNPDTWHVAWPALKEDDPREQAEIAQIITTAMKAFLDAGGEALMTPLDFLVHVLRIDAGLAEQMVTNVMSRIKDEDEEGREIDKAMEEDEDDSGEEEQ